MDERLIGHAVGEGIDHVSIDNVGELVVLLGEALDVILGSPCRRWSLPLIGEEENNGCSGGALGAPLWVAPALGAELEWNS